MEYAEIIIDINNKKINRVFHYKIPENIKSDIIIGMRVFVPFGVKNSLKEGYIVGFTNKIDIDKKLIKEIKSIPDEYPIFSDYMIELAKFIAHKYYTTLARALQCIMPKIIKSKQDKYVYINYDNEYIHSLIDKIICKNNAQGKVLEILQKNDIINVSEIKSILGISISPILSLEKKDMIKVDVKYTKRNAFDIKKYDKTHNLVLNEEQNDALNYIKNKIKNNDKKPIVLHGVTGSGKTEIYLQLIEYMENKGSSSIILVPEISLTPQTVERFIGRFGEKVSVTHSRLSDGERFDQWKKAKDGDISIMVGARSAIFTPFKNIGVIIIDEEHEQTYKSERTPKYDTIEVAKKLCELTGAILILGSATPSIETYYKVKIKEYNIVNINERVNKSMPNVHIVDMRKELESGNVSIFSTQLSEAIKKNLEDNMQTILFLNRRGHSTFISCRKCGYVMECKNCNVNYTYHKSSDNLVCHYCNATEKIPTICPSCASKYIKYFGIGTQKIEEHIKKTFPNARVLRMDFDTTSKKNSHEIILNKFKNYDADILIGTQMIAKGLDFPRVSLVGVVACDLALNIGNYKSQENCFQILTQVSGRAGRADVKGNVFIQTYNPEHYSIIFAKNNDYLGFYNKEIAERELMFYPPFSNIFFILMSGSNEKEIFDCMTLLHKIMAYYNTKTNFQLSDVAKASIYKLNNKYRYKLMLKAKDEERLKNFVLYCVEVLEKNFNAEKINISLNLNPNFIQ